MVKDMIGNELKVGSLLEVKIPNGFVFGEVKEIHEGGRIHLATKQEQTIPTKVRIIVDITLNTMNPEGTLSGVVAVHSPIKGTVPKTPGLA